jgi:hypothetical protein
MNTAIPARVADCFAYFAAALHARVADRHRIDLRVAQRLGESRVRAICGEHGHVVPTSQGLCPTCAGIVFDAEQIARERRIAKWAITVGLYDCEGADRMRSTAPVLAREQRELRLAGRQLHTVA